MQLTHLVPNLSWAALCLLFVRLLTALLLALASPKPNKTESVRHGNCTACTNLHILLHTAEKHQLEHLAASAQAWGASPNLRYGELFDTHRIREKKIKSKGARKQEVHSTCTIIHKHLLLFVVQFCFSPLLPAFTACILPVSNLFSPVPWETAMHCFEDHQAILQQKWGQLLNYLNNAEL